MFKHYFLLGFLYLQILPGTSQIPKGIWRGILQLNDTTELPFNFQSDGRDIVVMNGDERIAINEIKSENDSVIIQMPVFDSEFHCKLNGDRMSGYFYNHARVSKNKIQFHAENNKTYRFFPVTKESPKISGRYHVIFDGEDEESKDAVAILEMKSNKLTGTFLTTTGDYRYLEGNYHQNKIYLSAFDGSHLFLFIAEVKGDSLIDGHYYSGMHWHDTWHGARDADFKMPSAESFTYLKPGIEKLDFTFPDENGKPVSLADEKFRDKPVIVQIMGTWCPNCLDETMFLTKWYEKNKDSIEVIALDYERIVTQETASRNIKRLRQRLNTAYTILFAGSSDKKEASKTLPMLNRVFAFPTTIFLDRNKKVAGIHSGFSGPGTGDEYLKFREYFERMIQQIKR